MAFNMNFGRDDLLRRLGQADFNLLQTLAAHHGFLLTQDANTFFEFITSVCDDPAALLLNLPVSERTLQHWPIYSLYQAIVALDSLLHADDFMATATAFGVHTYAFSGTSYLLEHFHRLGFFAPSTPDIAAPRRNPCRSSPTQIDLA
jgi:hypothetical protein